MARSVGIDSPETQCTELGPLPAAAPLPPGERHPGAFLLVEERERNLGLGLEFHILRHTRAATRIRIRGPALRQVMITASPSVPTVSISETRCSLISCSSQTISVSRYCNCCSLVPGTALGYRVAVLVGTLGQEPAHISLQHRGTWALNEVDREGPEEFLELGHGTERSVRKPADRTGHTAPATARSDLNLQSQQDFDEAVLA